MGFKATCIYVFDEDWQGRAGQGFFPAGSWPCLNSRLLSELGLTSYELVSPKAVEDVVHAKFDELYIGEFESGFALYSYHVFSLLEDTGEDEFRERLIKVAGTRTILGIALESRTEQWACALWKQGELIRVVGGSADGGDFEDGSVFFPEEKLMDPGEGYEEFVFAVAKRFLGFDFMELGLPLFKYMKSAA